LLIAASDVDIPHIFDFVWGNHAVFIGIDQCTSSSVSEIRPIPEK